MIIGNDYIFIHLHKCGGTQVSNVLKMHYKGTSLKGKHSTLTLEEFQTFKNKGYKIIGVLRNPYAWYVSLFAFGCNERGAFFQDIKNNVPHILNLYTDCNNANNFEKWLKFITKDNGEGLLTKRIKEMYYIDGELIVDSFLRTESLSDDLCHIFGEKVGVRENMKERAFSSVHMPYEQYYTFELKQLVKKKDHFAFQQLINLSQ